MAIQRIDSRKKRMHGYQARAHISIYHSPERLTAFISDAQFGGKSKARQAAQREEAALKREAKRIQRAMGLV